MTTAPDIQPHPTTLKLGFRNPGHFLFSYCSHLCRNYLWVRSPDPLPEGTSVKLEFVIPGQRWTERLAARVIQSQSQADRRGPPGMGLALEPCEAILGELADRMVPLSQPCRVDMVGANAFSTRHLAAITQAFMDCRIEHRELREEVALRCTGADLVIVDLEVQEELGLELVCSLAEEPNAPTLVVLCQDLDTPAARISAQLAQVAQLPLERNEFRQAMQKALSQTCWLGAQQALRVNDTMPNAAIVPPTPIKRPVRLRTASPDLSVSSLRPSTESEWSVHTSWSPLPEQDSSQTHRAMNVAAANQGPTQESVEAFLDEIEAPMSSLEDTQEPAPNLDVAPEVAPKQELGPPAKTEAPASPAADKDLKETREPEPELKPEPEQDAEGEEPPLRKSA